MAEPSLLMIDLWSLFWQHVFRLGDPARAASETLARVGSLRTQHDMALCVTADDTSWRDELRERLGAPRQPKGELALLELANVELTLEKRGLRVLQREQLDSVDMVASAIEALHHYWDEMDSRQLAPEIFIYSGKKLLRQLVRYSPPPEIKIISLDGSLITKDGVLAEDGIEPYEYRDFAALMGINGIGKVKAAEIVKAPHLAHTRAKPRTLGVSQIVSMCAQGALMSHLPHSQKLVERAAVDGTLKVLQRLTQLRTDAPIDGRELWTHLKAQRKGQIMTTEPIDIPPADDTLPGSAPAPEPEPSEPISEQLCHAMPAPEPSQSTAIIPVDADWTKELEPRNANDAKRLAKNVLESGLFKGYGTAQAAFLVIMAGREFGLGTMASLRSFHIVENRPCLSAQAMMGLCLRHPSCEYFMVTERSSTSVTVEAKRTSWPKAAHSTFTLEDAKQAGLTGRQNWQKYPRAMLTNRAIAEAARFWFPDVVGGLYDPDEVRP